MADEKAGGTAELDRTLILDVDLIAAVDRGIQQFMAMTDGTGHHGRDMEALLRQAFKRPNPELMPLGVVTYYAFAVSDLKQLLTCKYPIEVAALALMPIRAELEKLPGVKEVFEQVSAEMGV